jgi:sugar fermentation stimulation protein A
MKFKSPLIEAILLKRSFRFLAEVTLKNKKRRMLYCPNLGTLQHCDVLGSRVWFSNPNRLSQGYLDIWELTEVDGGWLVFINQGYAGLLVREAIENHLIPELEGFRFLQSPMMPSFGHGIEMLLKENGEQCFIYTEPVLCGNERNEGYFPEEKGRGISALGELMALKEAGHRAILFYCIQHNGITCLRPADSIDLAYGIRLREAANLGVEFLAYRAHISLQEVTLGSVVPVLLTQEPLGIKSENLK